MTSFPAIVLIQQTLVTVPKTRTLTKSKPLGPGTLSVNTLGSLGSPINELVAVTYFLDLAK